MRIFLALFAALIVSACASINTASVIQKATVVTAALNLKDSYLAAKDVIVQKFDDFSESDKQIILDESAHLEGFYKDVSSLGQGDTGELLITANQAVNLSDTVRISARTLVDAVKRNLSLFDPVSRSVIVKAIRNVEIVDLDVTRTLAIGDREAKKQALLQLLKTATSLALAVSQARS